VGGSESSECHCTKQAVTVGGVVVLVVEGYGSTERIRDKLRKQRKGVEP